MALRGAVGRRKNSTFALLALSCALILVSGQETNLAADAADFSTYFGKGADDGVSAVRIGADCAVYVTGTTSSPGFPTTPGAYDRTYAGQDDGFITSIRLSPP